MLDFPIIMDGKRIQDYWSNEVDALLETYKQFETLIPNESTKGAAHRGEDGRYVEALLRSYLKRFIPKGLELLSGFILRPSVKTGVNGRERAVEEDQHSSQLDILVYDSARFPVFQRFENSAVVPPEGVIAVLSVKKHLRDTDIKSEALALKSVSRLCKCLAPDGTSLRQPFLGLVGMRSEINKQDPPTEGWIFAQLQTAYDADTTFNDCLGYIGAIDSWSIFKRRPEESFAKAEYIYLRHKKNETHLALQFLLTGIFSVYYDPSRLDIRRPGFTAFPSHRSHDKLLGEIKVVGR